MRKGLALSILAAMTICGTAVASSPLPQFEKEAIEDTYRRTGDMEIKNEVKVDGLKKGQFGNTGTNEKPACYVKKIKLTGATVEDRFGELQGILGKYEHKNLTVEQLRELQQDVSKFLRDRGYTVSFAGIPPQEIVNGVLEVRLNVASYDQITRTSNTSDVADRVLDKYIEQIKPGTVIRDIRLEKTLNRLNDLPGVQATATLKPGSKKGTTSLDLAIERRPVWNNYIFADNGGTKHTGRYRYGFYTEYNNPGHNGDKIGVSGMRSNTGDMLAGSVRYEAPVGYRGTRMGVAVSLTDYDSVDFETGGYRDSKGRSEGVSYYGFTPIYRDKRSRVHAVWGFDHRRLKDKYIGNDYRESFNAIFGFYPLENKRHANVLHIGFNGSEYEKNRFTQYSAIWWWGNVTCDQNALGGKTYDNEGSFHKGTAELTHIIFDGKTNYRVNMNGQLANRNLDSSEAFYIGGMNSVRAYNGSTYAGSNGLYWCTEVRRNVGIEGLEVAAFFEGADAGFMGTRDKHRTLHGWGLGLRYRDDNNWHAQVDYGRKLKREKDVAQDDTSKGRWWFQVYKMF